MTETTQTPVFYDIVKHCRGTLALQLPAFDSSMNDRRVEIPYNVEKVRVPRAFALGVFVNGTLTQMYKDGVFSVEPAAIFEQEVADIFYPVEDKKPIINATEIKDYLVKGNRVKIKELVEGNPVAKDNIITVARENIGDISSSMIKFIETLFATELVVEDDEQ